MVEALRRIAEIKKSVPHDVWEPFGGRVGCVFVEVKKKRQGVRRDQDLMHKILKSVGIEVKVAFGVDIAGVPILRSNKKVLTQF